MEKIRGWVYRVRDMGKVKFILLRLFPENRIEQVVVKAGNVDENTLSAVEGFYPETLIEVEGEWKKTDKVKSGREFVARKIRVISPSKPTPIDLTGKTPTDYSKRIQYRWLDVRRPEVSAVLRLKGIILKAARDYLRSQGFVETTLPIIISAAAEGGAELFPVVYFDREAFLAQSGQLYKQALVPSLGRVFTIGPSFRAEKSRTRKHLTEFWEIDAEAAFVDKKDLMDIEFGIYRSAAKALNEYPELFEVYGGEPPEVPKHYEVIDYDEALEILRSDGIEIPWGEDFGAPEERQLCSHFDVPFFISRFPRQETAFYYKVDRDDPRYAHKMDFLAPGKNGMELSSGGIREE
ncbi:MAG: aspartate--tRNA(Asn) ligase, partial [Candidatus Diapherotrites archaeon]|nr:aspartate--tRNA(Asn) ligase [Candidatus Diapherotrites archaeon]